MENSENTSTSSTTRTKDSKTQSRWPASFSEEDKVKVMQAKAIVGLHEWSIEPGEIHENNQRCLLYTSPSPRDLARSRMPSSA